MDTRLKGLFVTLKKKKSHTCGEMQGRCKRMVYKTIRLENRNVKDKIFKMRLVVKLH